MARGEKPGALRKNDPPKRWPQEPKKAERLSMLPTVGKPRPGKGDKPGRGLELSGFVGGTAESTSTVRFRFARSN